MRIRNLCYIFAAVIVLCTHSLPVFAQAAESSKNSDLEMKITPREVLHYKKVSEGYTKGYSDILKEIKKGRIDVTRIGAIRTYYPKTMDYTPFSETIINRMTAFAYIADTSSDQAEVNNALAEYQNLLDKHLANFDVLTFALTMARVDVRFGDELLINSIRKKMVEDLTHGLLKGTGPDRAYIISTYGEETYVLEQYGGVVKNSELFKVGRSFYNVHDVELSDGTVEQIFMNVTDPIRNIRLQQLVRESETRIVIPGQ